MDVLAITAGIFAGVSGFALSYAAQIARAQRSRRELAKAAIGKDGLPSHGECLSGGMAARAIGYMCERSRALDAERSARTFRRLANIGKRQFHEVVAKTGLASRISHEGFADARFRISLLAGAAGALAGLIFSTELALVLAAVFLCLGWRLPLWALKQERSARKLDMEHHLSEMIEVVALGLRSGLSFDMAFALYHAHFDTGLGRESSSAQKRWSMGLASREAALRDLASSYDSLLFARVVENIVRSIRFGSSLAESLEASAGEARALYKASMEEKVAKAPVKMLVPTATLILPAMLLLVLGPIMLELMQGF